jgi:MarR family transcriptional regulator, organic hydroperoxide resistance regulator
MLSNIRMQTTFPEPKYLLFYLTVQAAKHMVAHYNKALAPLGITAHQMIALGVLWQENDLSLGEFARRSGIGKAAAVSMIKRLEDMGLVSRAPNSKDARLNVLNLTEKAHGLVPELVEKVANVEKAVESAVGDKKMRSLIKGLSVLKDMDLSRLSK